jgi:2-polyprenyl-6-methoxyphenol hydroxylase-like FAD-dependent oxidoreductase
MRGIIIGAGIGGLSTAIAMQMRHINVNVFEAATSLNPIGAGILVPPNAMTILDRYNLAQQVRDGGNPIETLTVLDSEGKRISKTPAHYSKNGIVHQTIAIHRGVLQKILLSALAPDTVLTSKRCAEVSAGINGAEATFRDGTKVCGEFLVGADGIHSKVRESIFPDSPLRYSGQTCWRGVSSIALPKKWLMQLTEIWGAGLRFGFVPIADTQVYWYATKREDAGGIDDPANIKKQLVDLYGEFLEPVGEIILQTDTFSIIRDDISDLASVTSWFSNSVILIGDAAHASTPNLGQGGAQAIEDSWVLAEKITTCETLQSAFEKFQASRFAKVKRIVNVSWQIGKATNLSNKMACEIRNTLFRCVPSFMTKQQSRLIYDVPY